MTHLADYAIRQIDEQRLRSGIEVSRRFVNDAETAYDGRFGSFTKSQRSPGVELNRSFALVNQRVAPEPPVGRGVGHNDAAVSGCGDGMSAKGAVDRRLRFHQTAL